MKSAAFAGALSDGAYRTGEWWVVGRSGEDGAYSTDDGETWTIDTLNGFAAAARCIGSDGTADFVVGGIGATGRRNASGVWSSPVFPGTVTNVRAIKWIDFNNFIAVGGKAASAGYIARSTNGGAAWTEHGAPASFAAINLGSLAVSPGGIVVASAAGAANTKLAFSSNGGVGWGDSTTNLVSNNYQVAYNSARAEFIAVGGLGSNVYTSTNGDTWTSVGTIPGTPNINIAGTDAHNVTAYGKAHVVFGLDQSAAPNRPKVFYSIDGGVTWKVVFTGVIGSADALFSDNSGRKAMVASDLYVYHCLRNAAE
jgi:hypothetical protein